MGVSPEDPPTVVPDVKEGSLSINSEKIISSEPIGVKHKSSSVPQVRGLNLLLISLQGIRCVYSFMYLFKIDFVAVSFYFYFFICH